MLYILMMMRGKRKKPMKRRRRRRRMRRRVPKLVQHEETKTWGTQSTKGQESKNIPLHKTIGYHFSHYYLIPLMETLISSKTPSTFPAPLPGSYNFTLLNNLFPLIQPINSLIVPVSTIL
jgi:hypothetical protein